MNNKRILNSFLTHEKKRFLHLEAKSISYLNEKYLIRNICAKFCDNGFNIGDENRDEVAPGSQNSIWTY